MSEQETSHEEIEAFREEISEAIEHSIFVVTTGQEEDPLSIDPFSLGLSDDYTLAELSPEKAAIVKQELYKAMGIMPDSKPTTTYQTDEELSVSVFSNTLTDEEENEMPFFVHEIKHPDGELDWQLSNSSDPLL